MPTRVLLTIFAALLLWPLAAGVCQVAGLKNSVPKEHKKLAREQVEAMEQSWKKAQLAGDVTGMDKLLSDDYIGITSTGEVLDKPQQLEHMRSRKLVITELEASDMKIKLIGPIAIVTSLAQLKGVSDGQPLEGGYRYTRVYQRLPSGVWKITNFEATHIPNRPRGPRQVSQQR